VLVAVDAETGDVLQTQQTLWSGESGAMPFATTYADYREVGGLRVRHRYIESNEFLGRAIYQADDGPGHEGARVVREGIGR
jgi:hypothetical protein